MERKNVTWYRLGISYTCTALRFNMERENVTGYRLGISYTCTALRYKPAFIASR